MKDAKVLVLCTFPIENASHGGQVRVENIVGMFSGLGAQVTVAGVLGGDHYAPSAHFVGYPGAHAFSGLIANSFLMEDWSIGRLFSESDYHYQSLRSLIEIEPDIIHVEHPWLMRFALRLREDRAWTHCRIIYGSANVEHELKQRILARYLSAREAVDNAALVYETEIEALAKADAVICVSESDMAFCKGHTQVPLVLAENGVAGDEATVDDIVDAHRLVGEYKYALFTASAHPPNVTGFYTMFPTGLTALAPDERLVIAGSAGESILGHEKARYMPRLGSGSIVTGIVKPGDLRGLNHNAHAIVLPITEGSGTNLKTAEALWAGVHIVATRLAMRGFETFIESPGVHVHDEPLAFQAALRQVMNSPRLVLSDGDLKKRETVLWRNTLKRYGAFVEKLVRSK